MSLLVACTPEPPAWRPCAHVPAVLDECSGLVASRRQADVFWAHNDSGDTPRLFALDRNGQVRLEVHVRGARHVDWEDIATDDAGRLYIGDFGNNANARRDLVIYVVPEPSVPATPTPRIAEVDVTQRLRFRFPDQHAFPDPQARNFDCEALFVDAGRVFVLTKHRSDTRSTLYEIPTSGAADGEGERVAVRLGDWDAGSMVTAADLSPDGRTLVVLTYQYLWWFERPRPGPTWLEGASHRMLLEGRQCEAVCFAGDAVWFANEQREVYCLPAHAWRRLPAFLPPRPHAVVRRLAVVVDGVTTEWSEVPALALHPEIEDVARLGNGEAAPGRPEVRLAWDDGGLLVHLRLAGAAAVPTPHASWEILVGPPGARTPESGRGVRRFSGRLTPAGAAGGYQDDGAGSGEQVLTALATHRNADHTDVEMRLPLPAGAPPRAGDRWALHVTLRAAGTPEPVEWAWGGTRSTQPEHNPLLWGEVTLGDGP